MTEQVNLPLNQIVKDDSLRFLKTLPDNSVDCAMTSPPYWSLREYAGGEETHRVWGGVEGCEHEWVERRKRINHVSSGVGLQASNRGTIGVSGSSGYSGSKRCSKCGAWKGALGLEPDPFLYVEHLLEVFAEVKRVLEPTGSFWLNMGDARSGNQEKRSGWTDNLLSFKSREEALEAGVSKYLKAKYVLPAKSLMMLPERVAMRMVDEQGWGLADRCIWHKPSRMPESVQGRLTHSWEYLYRFTKNSKALLWRNRVTKEWVNVRPVRQQYFSEGKWGDSYLWWCEDCDAKGSNRKERTAHKETGHETKASPNLWVGFSEYFELDSIRVPNQVVGVTDMRPNGILTQKFYKGSRERYGSANDPHLRQYMGKFAGFGEEAEKYGSPRARTQRQLGAEKLSEREATLKVFFESKGSGGNPGHGIQGSTLGSTHPEGKNPGDVVEEGFLKQDNVTGPNAARYKGFNKRWKRAGQHSGFHEQTINERGHSGYYDKEGNLLVNPLGKNPGDMFEDEYEDEGEEEEGVEDFWSLTTEGSKEKHFAMYPLKLCFLPIMATCPPDNGIVLDPFAGTGTTAEATEILNVLGRMPKDMDEVKDVLKNLRSGTKPLSKPHNRRWIMVDISEDYVKIMEKRLSVYR